MFDNAFAESHLTVPGQYNMPISANT